MSNHFQPTPISLLSNSRNQHSQTFRAKRKKREIQHQRKRNKGPNTKRKLKGKKALKKEIT